MAGFLFFAICVFFWFGLFLIHEPSSLFVLVTLGKPLPGFYNTWSYTTLLLEKKKINQLIKEKVCPLDLVGL